MHLSTKIFYLLLVNVTIIFQSIALDKNDFQEETLLNIIEDLEQKFDIHFTYDREIVEDVLVHNYLPDSYISVDQALTSILKDTPKLQYVIVKNRFVIIYQKGPEGIKALDEMTELLQTYSQITVNGKVLNLHNEQPMPFVNIGIINSAIGTISDADGNFTIKIPNSYINDSVIFYQLGFEKLFVAVSELSKEDAKYTIYLKVSPTNLKPVTIISDSWKKKKYRLGNKSFEGSSIYADTVTAGSAMALLIKNSFDFPVYVRQVQLKIVNNTFGEFKVRARLYEKDSTTGLPGKDILNESVIARSSLENGLLKVDLSKYNVEINGDFFLAFEWILDKDDRAHLFQQYDEFLKKYPDKVSMDYSYIDGKKVPYINYMGNLNVGPTFGISVYRKTLEKHVCYYRLNSFGKWFRSTTILCANVIVINVPFTEVNNDKVPQADYHDYSDELSPYFKMEFLAPQIESEDYTEITEESDSIFFDQRIHRPILLEVKRLKNQLTFTAINQSYYPYQLELFFKNIKNLTPIVTNKSFIVDPGHTTLLVLDVVDPSKETLPTDNFHYELSTKNIIGNRNKIPSKGYPYLIPVGNQKKINLILSQTDEINEHHNNVFNMSSTDTVFAMRKGIVTATPLMKSPIDRISNNKTLEVQHGDGTVMVYKNMNPQNVLIPAGENVFPGQPLGIINSNSNLEVELYQISGNASLILLDIYYFTGEKANSLYSQIREDHVVNYPDHIVMKELTKREISKYQRNSLYRYRVKVK